ncbi:MAG: hypothetical protein HYU66_11390 [Armatimonadetes bacterium]|nr:hypothetical protein [Armatimonadota bacterium]
MIFHGQPFEVVAVLENTGRAPFTEEHSLTLQFGGVSDAQRPVARLNPGETLSVTAPAKPVAAPGTAQVTCTATWHPLPAAEETIPAPAETVRAEGRFRVFAAPAQVPAERAMNRELQILGDTIVLQNQHARVILTEGGAGAVLFEVADAGGYRRLAAAPSLCELCLGDTPAELGKPEVGAIAGGCQVKLPVQGVAASITVRLRLSPGDGLLNVAVELNAAADIGVRALRGPAVLVGDGGRGEHKLTGLLPGLEYLAADEPSSSTRDFAPALALRLVPDPYKVCIPLMAVESEDGLVGLLWDQTAKWHAERFMASALFASPNFLDGQANHRLQLFVPSGPDLIQENQLLSTAPYALAAGQTMTLEQQVLLRPKGNVLDAIDAWTQIYHGLPEPQPHPRDFEAELALSRWGFMHSVWDEKTSKSRHCVGWPDQNAPNFATLLLTDALVTKDAAGAAEARRHAGEAGLASNNCCHIMRSTAPFVAGHLDGAYAALRAGVYGAIGGMGADGSWRYHPDAERTSLGEDGAAELGTCAGSASAIWRWARMTGDPEAIAAGRKALAFMDRFVVPAGAQGWECPIHEPDILAAAHAIRAYVDAFVTTGDAAYLTKATYWARSGLPFCYFWDDPAKPGMRYATIPVLGSTYFTHSWLGVPVQWCGLVYAYALQQLAPYDGSRDWKKVAEGITVSGMYQQFGDERPELKGCYPDGWYGRFTQRNAPFINPEDVILNYLALRGLDPEVQTAIAKVGNESFHLSSGARIGDVKLVDNSLTFTLTAPPGAVSCTMLPFVATPAAVALAGKPASTGPDLDAPGVNTMYDGGNAVLFLKVSHGADPVRVVVDGLRHGEPGMGAPKRSRTFP